MQGLTTKEPTPDMVEVAIVAVEKVFDWRKYLKENF
jgi:putative lipoprotein